jgi:lipopolysaccharide export system protein LptC
MSDRLRGNRLTIASQIERATPGGFMTPRRDNRRAFRAAMRHSRLVRITRVGLPIAIVVVAGAFAAYQWLDPMRALARLPVSTEGMVISGTKIIMQQPRLTGFTKDERPYTVIARTAAKELTDPDKLELRDIHTTVAMPDGRKMVVTARDGLYDGKTEMMRLKNNVVLTSAEYELMLQDALINIRAGSVVSEQPVEVQMLQGTITANRIEVGDSGEVIRFGGGVTLLLDREDKDAPASKSFLPGAVK